jgi:hypothetical protein
MSSLDDPYKSNADKSRADESRGTKVVSNGPIAKAKADAERAGVSDTSGMSLREIRQATNERNKIETEMGGFINRTLDRRNAANNAAAVVPAPPNIKSDLTVMPSNPIQRVMPGGGGGGAPAGGVASTYTVAINGALYTQTFLTSDAPVLVE